MTPAQAIAITLRQQAGQDGLPNKYIALLDDLLTELCVTKLYTSQQPAQKTQEFIHDPAEIRRVFEIDEADYPPPDSGFVKL